jgi:filamentous hemagglutinin family protein
VTFAAVLSFLVARGVQLQAQTAQARDQIARQQEQLEEAKQTHRVLCSLKDANHHSVIDGRVALKRSRQILKDNPNGITFGSTHFSHAQLVQSVRTQEATQKRTERAAAAYAGLKHCPKP